eukprot:TRINITY_DN361_c0_g1_i1.p1 TRINITY_DN361_c0_g1~~TRINITY_DN361_c0_g1_i1.p1  ORF type:complete len:475 (+),score=88.65 TRINITY_DN361_c0_g1_i1:120-1544(+)
MQLHRSLAAIARPSFKLLSGVTKRHKSTESFASMWPVVEDPSAPQFVVTPKNGFLPREDPLPSLPPKYQALEDILNRMSLKLENGQTGLLGKGEFGPTIDKSLPEYDVSNIKDTRLLLALFRDYTFAVSAYLLEPCDLRYKQGLPYGKGRDILPRSLAVPLSKISEQIGSRPFMEYAQTYALANYKRINPQLPPEYDNLELIRKPSGLPSEHGFILTHVAMVRYSGDLVKYVIAVLDAVNQGNRDEFNRQMDNLNATMFEINRVMETMWKVSAPKDYNEFRTFIMGTKNQKEMFPDGVLYSGVSAERVFYRGESGANDSIVPTLDNLLQLTQLMPSNELTDILRDFRTYRPVHHNKWLNWTEEKSKEIGVRKFALADPLSTLKYLTAMDHVRDFRNRHWNFAKEYILKYSSHPVATGGSPIKTWLPNQLTTVLDTIISTGKSTLSSFPASSKEAKEGIEKLIERSNDNYRTLKV